MKCIFCKIINNEIPSYTIYEDDIVKCFLDINPDSMGHCLIIPKKHYKDLFEIDDTTLLHILNICKNISSKIIKVLKAEGITLIQNNGDIQEVKHFHIHIKPYYKNIINMSIEEVYTLLKKEE